MLEALNESFEMVRDIFQINGIDIDFKAALYDYKPNETEVHGDRGKFQQIFINLLNNAKDALENSLEKCIEINYKIENDQIIISIRDTGAGIPEEIQSRIFDPFFTTKDVHKGTGIGLALVHNFVKEMKGDINFETDKGKGTTFYLSFPLENMHMNQDFTGQGETCSLDNSSVNILIADDEEGIREILSDMLGDLGHKVETFENGKLALESFSQNPKKYQLIITDIKMPEMDGVTFFNEIKKISSPEFPRILITTGGVSGKEKEAAMEVIKKSDGCLYKPFTNLLPTKS